MRYRITIEVDGKLSEAITKLEKIGTVTKVEEVVAVLVGSGWNYTTTM